MTESEIKTTIEWKCLLEWSGWSNESGTLEVIIVGLHRYLGNELLLQSFNWSRKVNSHARSNEWSGYDCIIQFNNWRGTTDIRNHFGEYQWLDKVGARGGSIHDATSLNNSNAWRRMNGQISRLWMERQIIILAGNLRIGRRTNQWFDRCRWTNWILCEATRQRVSETFIGNEKPLLWMQHILTYVDGD